MARCARVSWAVAAWVAALAACSSSGGGPGNGMVTFSCNAPVAGICTQLPVPAAEVSSESSSCTESEKGTPGTGCPSTGIVGCCKYTGANAGEEQCYYDATVAQAGMGSCTSMMGTWSTTM